MSDLSKLSDKDLEEMLVQTEAPSSGEIDLGSLSDDQLTQMLSVEDANEPEEKSFTDNTIDMVMNNGGKEVLDAAIYAGEKIDSVTGAPTRAAIQAAQNAENPISAFANQFAEDPNQAPTGKELVQKVGVSDSSLSDLFPNLYTSSDKEAEDWLKFKKGGAADISASGAAGLGMDMISDPTSLIAGPALKGLQKSGKAIRKLSKVEKIINNDAVKMAKQVGRSASNTIDDVGRAVTKMNNPQRSQNYEALLKIAKRNNISPDDLPHAVEFGQNSFPSRMERFKAEGPLGESLLKKMDGAYEKIDGALEDQISNIGGSAPKGEQFAGELIRDGFDEAVDKLSKNTDITYGNIHKVAPGLPLSESAAMKLNSKLVGIEKWATGKVKRGIPGESLSEAKHMKAVVAAVRRSNGSVKQTVEAMQDIGALAFKSTNYMEATPKDIKKLRDLYFSLSESVLESVDSGLGPGMANSLKENNRVFKQFFDDKSFISQIGSRRVSNEALFNSIVKNGDSNQIGALKRLLSPEKIQQLKGEFLGSLVKRNLDGEISFKQLHTVLERGKGNLNLFSSEEIQGIKDIIKLRTSMGNRSLFRAGSGPTNQLRDFVRHPVDSLVSNTIGDTLSQRHIAKARNFESNQVLKNSQKAISQAKKVESSAKITSGVKKLTSGEKLDRLAALSPATARLISSQSKDKEPKGRNKWALDGVDNLLNTKSKVISAKNLETLYKSKKGVDLIISASGLKPSSKAMRNTLEKIYKHLEKEGNK